MQGREKEVIVFCAVRSNPARAVGFLADARRLNTALTRARRGLVVIGNRRTLSADRTWSSWLAWIDEHELAVKTQQLSADGTLNTGCKLLQAVV